MNPASIEPRQAMVQWKPRLSKPLSAIQRYGLAILSVFVALCVALLLDQFQFRNVEVPLFLFAVAISAWYGGTGGAVLALLLSFISFDYFFTEPYHTLYITRADLPYFIVVASFASLVTWFSIVRRRVEGELRQTRDDLQIQVAERTQQASLLNLTHDTIFVRDMNDVITYWNRGAQELYGWTAEEAVGKRAHQLCKRLFRRPSTRFVPNCCAPGVGTANSKRPELTEPKWWWRAGGPCGAMSTGSPLRVRPRARATHH
jgi:K+-sensing histidine kinase KdpD